MAEIYLVRHGQASFGAQNYDQLSPLGYQQGQWLGEYFSARDIAFDFVLTGTLERQKQTYQAMCKGMDTEIAAARDPALNEFEFRTVLQAYQQRFPEHKLAAGAEPASYYRLLKQAMLAWSGGALDEYPLAESWQQFEQRAMGVLERVQQLPGKRGLLVTSGGAIAMMLRHILGYDPQTVVNINLQIKNASFSQCFVSTKGWHLHSFNNLPHLDVPQRQHSITYS